MAVDRTARAWVLYSSGEIFWVNTTDASCKSSGYAKLQSGFETFGMGFVSDAEGSEKESLFVAGGSYINQRVADLASIDAGTLQLKNRRATAIWTEQPRADRHRQRRAIRLPSGAAPFVGQIDKPTPGRCVAGACRQWVAHRRLGICPLGRSLLHFHHRPGWSSGKSMVWEFDPATGKATEKTNASYKIVGAGVSTCAPVVIGVSGYLLRRAAARSSVNASSKRPVRARASGQAIVQVGARLWAGCLGFSGKRLFGSQKSPPATSASPSARHRRARPGPVVV